MTEYAGGTITDSICREILPEKGGFFGQMRNFNRQHLPWNTRKDFRMRPQSEMLPEKGGFFGQMRNFNKEII